MQVEIAAVLSGSIFTLVILVPIILLGLSITEILTRKP
jgi:hypothetical protein